MSGPSRPPGSEITSGELSDDEVPCMIRMSLHERMSISEEHRTQTDAAKRHLHTCVCVYIFN